MSDKYAFLNAHNKAKTPDEVFTPPIDPTANNEVLNKSEGRIQSEAFAWFWNTFPDLRGLLYHVPNGEQRDKITASKLKAMGVVAGIPDIVFHFAGRTWFFEFKDGKGSVSKAQEKIHDIMRAQGFVVYVVRTVEHFQETINSIVNADAPNKLRLGLTKAEYYYRHNVFNWLYEDLGHCQLVLISSILSEPNNRVKFVDFVKEFISHGYDAKAGFEILFTPDYLAVYKKEQNRPLQPIFYEGKSIIE